ncbi:hypothetical protein Vadar_030708 [Vaccinium darrowii]|uniref:Uncharacterized protein n=1 Tax=Vaccinium darrowii TaxID=229202 RepID=A0ACB7ZMW5_9ERIC|nr:hypothetical protein Vadar_030708 [Vaccinium darrowii]
MRNLAWANYVGKFNFIMEELGKEGPGTFARLSHPDKNSCHRFRSHFILTPKCDILLNNFCKPFNEAILFARDKPIQALLERLRLYLMDRVIKRRALAITWVDGLGPKIHTKIEKVNKMYGDYYVVPCDDGEFEEDSIVVSTLARAAALRQLVVALQRFLDRSSEGRRRGNGREERRARVVVAAGDGFVEMGTGVSG